MKTNVYIDGFNLIATYLLVDAFDDEYETAVIVSNPRRFLWQ
jgi:hypothetical protein